MTYIPNGKEKEEATKMVEKLTPLNPIIMNILIIELQNLFSEKIDGE